METINAPEPPALACSNVWSHWRWRGSAGWEEQLLQEISEPIVLKQIALKATGTVMLAAGFLLLVSRAPFLPQSGSSPGATRASSPEHLQLPNLHLGTGVLVPDPSRGPQTAAGDPLQPFLGLLKSRISATPGKPGFETEEHRVPGACDGAGKRYIETVCPGCQILEGNRERGSPALLTWIQAGNGDTALSAVSADCTGVAPDGVPIVGTVRLGTSAVDLSSGASGDMAGDVVPLLPGANRLAVFEIGNWLATVDEVGSAGTALAEMAGMLRSGGWREHEVPSGVGQQHDGVQGGRVFTSDANGLCVVSFKTEGSSRQLLTIMNIKR